MNYTATTPLATSKLATLNIEFLQDYWGEHRKSITRRLNEFDTMKNAPGSRIFTEFCFCILTPQSNAVVCDAAMVELDKKGLLSDPVSRRNELERVIRNVRFWRNKAKYIIRAWQRFYSNGENHLKQEIIKHNKIVNNNRELRNWLRGEARGIGIGMKEASHFLRNIGYGKGLAIVDRHIIRCLRELGVIGEEEKVLRSEKDYLELEERMADFSSRTGIPLEELDMLLWSARTGYIFK
jgi:N-glycosylase/DNA lyase